MVNYKNYILFLILFFFIKNINAQQVGNSGVMIFSTPPTTTQCTYCAEIAFSRIDSSFYFYSRTSNLWRKIESGGGIDTLFLRNDSLYVYSKTDTFSIFLDYVDNTSFNNTISIINDTLSSHNDRINTIFNNRVTSVGVSLPASVFNISNSPVTSSGTLTATFATQANNSVFIGPISGGPSTPSFRVPGATDVAAWGGVTGTGGANNIALWTGTSTLGQDANQLWWNSGSNLLGLGTNAPTLDIESVSNVNNIRGLFINNTNTGTNARNFFGNATGSNQGFVQSFSSGYTSALWGGTYIQNGVIIGRYDASSSAGKLVIINSGSGTPDRPIEFHISSSPNASSSSIIADMTTAYSLRLYGTNGMILNVGTTAQRPTGVAGVIRYNSETGAIEWHNGSAWNNLASGSGTTNQIAFWGSTNSLTSNSALTFNSSGGGTLNFNGTSGIRFTDNPAAGSGGQSLSPTGYNGTVDYWTSGASYISARNSSGTRSRGYTYIYTELTNSAVTFASGSIGSPTTYLTLGSNLSYSYINLLYHSGSLAVGRSSGGLTGRLDVGGLGRTNADYAVAVRGNGTDVVRFSVRGGGGIVIGTDQTTATYSINVNTTDAIRFPQGNSGSRPTGAAGIMRFNTTCLCFETHDGTQWNNVITGALTTGQIMFAQSQSVIQGSSNLFWDNANVRLGIGTNTPTVRYHQASGGAIFTLTGNEGFTINGINNNNPFQLNGSNGESATFRPASTNFFGTGINGNAWTFGNTKAALGMNLANITLATNHPVSSIPTNSFHIYSAVDLAISNSQKSPLIYLKSVTSTISYITLLGGTTTGTNQTHNNTNYPFRIIGPLGTGTGVSGDIIFSTGQTGASGSDLHIATNRWWIKGGTGYLGNISSPNYSLDVSGTTDAIRFPSGNDATRPTGAAGIMRYSTTCNCFEWHNGSAWNSLVSGVGTVNTYSIWNTSTGLTNGIIREISSGQAISIGATTDSGFSGNIISLNLASSGGAESYIRWNRYSGTSPSYYFGHQATNGGSFAIGQNGYQPVFSLRPTTSTSTPNILYLGGQGGAPPVQTYYTYTSFGVTTYPIVSANLATGANSASGIQFVGVSLTGSTTVQSELIGTRPTTYSTGADIGGFRFRTKNGSTEFLNALEITSAGRLGVLTNSPSYIMDFNSSDAIRFPSGTTAQRPTAAAGIMRYNSDLSSFEIYNTTWRTVSTDTYGNLVTETTDGSGQITVTLPVTMVDATYAVTANSETTPYIFTISSKTTTTFVVTVWSGGSTVNSTSVTFNYIAKDY